MSGADATGDASVGIQLLADLRAMFEEQQTDRLASKEICEALALMEDRPWPEWKVGKPIITRQLAKLLKPFGIVPSTIRTDHGTPKGYRLEQFKDAFARYLITEPQQSHNQAAACHISNIASATEVGIVADGIGAGSPEIGPCGGVAAGEGNPAS